ncbi:MAG TPA: hypothetical protein VG106_08370 [Vicinamibacterales bacterium]|nr:hypothetical protein [Vicinamibacterales bacterium]
MSRTCVMVGLLMSSGALLGQAPPGAAPSQVDSRAPVSIAAAVRAAYQREFERTIEYPAIYNNPQALNCRGEGHLTTTAYIASGTSLTLLSMYMSRDAATVLRKRQSPVLLLPAGVIRVLVVLVQYPETVGGNGVALWEHAQNQINQDHLRFAESRGYKAPVVRFDNTNVIVDSAQVTNARSPAWARSVSQRRGVAPATYQLVMTIDLNPREREGGFAVERERSIYVGNYGAWKTPLTGQQWERVARTAYHHEVAHHWGWPATHDWAGSCGSYKPEYAPFVVPPVLLGWEDLDGDGQPDIVRATSQAGSH